ncbi:MAG: hypothetical protein SRB1_00574 [Desulfobacteraceae bacterium Eth-SRB1]|nr:MAG: hypothetical protein SRB1_00574 [Desulfobacteraceae bacterium Eth-SRB1]
MNKNDLIDLKKWFADYVSGFYTDNQDYNRAIRLKEDHTKRVCRDIIMLGQELGLTDYDMILAETMALFHDIGRFEQYAVYGTFSDIASENHALLGLRQICTHKILSVCSKQEKRLIAKAIAHHNAAELPKDEDEKTLFFMQLLRDADKLDIWRVVIDYYRNRDKNPNSTIELGLPDNPDCSQEILKALNEHRIARMQDLNTLNDFKLLQISWVFDLNFTPSFQAVQKRRYIEQIEATLPQSKNITEAVGQAHDYVLKHR